MAGSVHNLDLQRSKRENLAIHEQKIEIRLCYSPTVLIEHGAEYLLDLTNAFPDT